MKLYTDEHIKVQQELLYSIEDYSLGCLFLVDAIQDLINDNGYTEILDYGAGLARPTQLLDLNHQVQYFPYDPAIDKFAKRPNPKELTLVINVLEYCELEYVDQIIEDIAQLTKQSVFIALNTRPLAGIPPTIQKPNDWWICRIIKSLELSYLRQVGDGFVAIAEPLNVKTTLPSSSPKGVVEVVNG